MNKEYKEIIKRTNVGDEGGGMRDEDERRADSGERRAEW
jgi:hypothetical protein